MKTALATGLLLVSASLLSAQDAVKADPGHHKVIVENAYVRVLRITVPAGEKTAMHTHPANAVVFLTAATTRVTQANEKPTETSRKANDAIINDGATHTVENIGKTPLDLIMVELKSPPKGAAVKNDAVSVDPKHYKVIVENAQFRVLRATYGAGEKSKMHSHPALVAISLGDEQFKMHTPDGKTIDTPGFKRGDADFYDAVTHLPENAGKDTAEVILVELKPATT